MGSGWITEMEQCIVEVNVCSRYDILLKLGGCFQFKFYKCLMNMTHESYTKEVIY